MFDFNKPKIEITEISDDKKYGRFVVEPLERGYGITLGNSLRRIMLSSLPGAAVSQVKIEGVLHEFSSIPGVKEDVTEIIMNLKSLAIKNNSADNEPKTAYIECEGKGVVTAADIQADQDIEIMNPDQVIATLNGGKDCRLAMELTITKGRGYVSADKGKSDDMPIGVIAVDAIYSPVERVNMVVQNTRVGQVEWRATDTNGQLTELPLAIELKNFSIEEYPPKLMLIDNATGRALPDNAPAHLLLEEGVSQGVLPGWNIEVRNKIDMAASVSGEDTVRYVEWPSMGATCAVHVRATSADGKQMADGWVSCGSFLFPYQALRLDSVCSLVMPDREPRRFSSEVTIYTETGKKLEQTIEVNKPAKVEGWKIYQLSYDEGKGRWSDVSVFELVSDPWLPVVYVGIVMMMLGAVCMFVTAQKNNKC